MAQAQDVSPAQLLKNKWQILAVGESNMCTKYSQSVAAIWTEERMELNESQLWQSLTITQQSHGPDSFKCTEYLDALAWIQTSEGRIDQAVALYTKSLEIKRHALGEQHVAVACAVRNLADLSYRQGDYAQAESLAK